MNITNIDFGLEMTKRMGIMFYMVSPTIYKDVHHVPNFMHKAWPQLTFLFAIELVIRYCQGRKAIHYDEVIIHSGALMFAFIFRYFQYGVMLSVFEYIYENYRVITLPNHWRIWLYSIFLMEFMFYCAHRLLHEVNFLWASHQYHHSCKHFNVATAVRLSWFELNIVYYYTSLLAIAIPPPIMITHMQFMFLYQAWLHTETIGKLGFLEYIFNTPSHHRVHHARNRPYIDKNYGAYLIIFDRLFGTYAEETEKVVYGITTRVRGHNMIHQQVYYYTLINRKMKKLDKFTHKLLAIFAGPGWRPGTPRLGFNHEIPEVTDEMEGPILKLPLWQVAYTSFTCVITLIGFYLFANHSEVFQSSNKLLGGMFYIIITFTSIAAIYDKRPFAALVESFRCTLYYCLELYVFPWNTNCGDINHYIKTFFTFPNEISFSSKVFTIFRWYHTIAAIIWLFISFNNMRKNSQIYLNNNISKQQIISFTVKSERTTYYTALMQNLILILMLILLIVMLLMCCWFEYFNSHLM